MFSLSGLDGSRGEKTERTEKYIKETIKLKQKALFFRKFDYGRLRGGAGKLTTSFRVRKGKAAKNSF